CNNVECYVSPILPPGYTFTTATLQAALHGFEAKKELADLRKKLENVPWRHINKGLCFWSDKVGKFSILLPTADTAVVTSSQGVSSALLAKHGIFNKFFFFPSSSCSPSYKLFATKKKKCNALEHSLNLAATCPSPAFWPFSKRLDPDWGKKLMLRYPWWLSFGMFSENGPTSEQIDASAFVSEFFGEGYSHNVLRQYNNDPLQIPKHTKCDLA
ncbi:hypothetical protein RFI_29561, partial [Reticulomyxa filosa]